jgi:branched-chain amino acid transport system ATP-binding protein
MLELHDISTSYGGARAISDVSLRVASGEALAILGRNGAGKTTTLKTIMGLLKPRKGSVSFNDEDITAKAPDQIAQLGIGYVPEDRRVFAGLSVIENLETARKANPAAGTSWTASALLDLFPEIARRQDSMAGTLSGGEQQMLSIARAMMGNPSLLLLDEPSEGLAPVVVNRLGEALVELQTQGVSMLVSEQNQRLARRITNNVLLIDMGTLVFTGSFATLDENPDVIQRHLGV